LTHPPDIILIFDIVITHNGDEPLKDLLTFVVQNKNLFSTSIENHNIDTRQRNYLYLSQAHLTIYQKGAYYLRIKIFSNLYLEIKNVVGNQKKFKIVLKTFFYALIYFIQWKSTLVNHELPYFPAHKTHFFP